MIYVYSASGELTSPHFAQNFAAGSGGVIVYDNEPLPGAWAGFGSPQTWSSLQAKIAEGGEFYYGDHAYFHRRLYYRITKNAYQHNGFGEPDYNRLDGLMQPIRPWTKRGAHIVVCAQSQGHHDRHGCSNWVKETCRELAKYTDRPMIVRDKRSPHPLSVDLQHAWAVVTHTSNAAVDAVMAGVPAFVTAPCAASRVTKSSLAEIEQPLYADDRREWAGVLAANQWTMGEIGAGKAWRHLQGV